MVAEIERFAGRRGGRRLPAAACLADRAVPGRVRRVHRRQLRLAAVAADPAAGPAGRAGRLPALGHGGAPVPHRRTAAPGVHLPGALRGGSAAERAGGVRGDRLHGHRRRGVLPARRDAALPDAMAAAAADAGVEFIYGSTVSKLEWSGVEGHGGAHGRRAIGASLPTPSCSPPNFPTPTDCWAAHRAGCCRCGRRRRPSSPTSGAARSTERIGHHTILFGDAWDQTFRDIIDDGRVMGDPSLLVTRPTAGDPSLAPPGRDLLYILAPAPNTEVGTVDWDATSSAYVDADARRGHGATAPTRRRRRSCCTW